MTKMKFPAPLEFARMLMPHVGHQFCRVVDTEEGPRVDCDGTGRSIGLKPREDSLSDARPTPDGTSSAIVSSHQMDDEHVCPLTEDGETPPDGVLVRCVECGREGRYLMVTNAPMSAVTLVL